MVVRERWRFSTALVLVAMLLPSRSHADDGGISFWLPGLFGSMAAVPVTPGPSFTTLYYHSSVSAGGGKSFVLGGHVVAGVNANADLLAFGPTYTFAESVLGGQAAISLLGVGGHPQATINATLSGPMGHTISGSRSDAITAFGDMLPEATLKWNRGVNNFLTYLTGDIPVGSYDVTRLANTGLGHGAIDGGGGYSYFNPASGNEASITLGLTYNFRNDAANYQNGVDLHLDWGTSHFFSNHVQLGLVGYFYNQISPDTGAGATLGSFESRVGGVGPQVGYAFPIGNGAQVYVSVKGYKEFAAKNRPSGWNVWLAFVISRAPPPRPPPPATQGLYPGGHS